MSSPALSPALSVVVSAYNSQRYLREAVESILNQTFRDFELILIDDGSRDDTLQIAREFEARDNRVRLITRPNKGLTPSLNEGIDLARAPIIARMDADDVCMPDRFELQMKFLAENPDVVLLGAQVELVDPYGVHIGDCEYPPDHDAINARLIGGDGGVMPHPVVMYRTDAVRKLGGYRVKFNNSSEDLDLWLRLSEVGRVANIPKILLKYRRDLGSISHKSNSVQVKHKPQIIAEAYERRGLPKPAEWKFTPWTPKSHDVQLKEWGWKALRVGRLDAARGHAKALLKLKPTSFSSWKLAYCAWRGR
ncbi:MAG TPA: glycosyltransferase [Tepidisphaeraceae bacterium]|jgi:hypothetical protein